MADDGNYSIQVLSKALSVWDIQLVPISSPDVVGAKENPTYETFRLPRSANLHFSSLDQALELKLHLSVI